jgi:hypothetical protein
VETVAVGLRSATCVDVACENHNVGGSQSVVQRSPLDEVVMQIRDKPGF